MSEFITKDSGQRVDFPSGMRRDVADDKPNFALCLAEGVPYEDQLLTRWAALMQRGAKKYGDRNWEQANSQQELERFRSSALRHMIQWATGANPEEDHAAAVVFNLAAYEAIRLKLKPVRTIVPALDNGQDWFTEKAPDLTLRVGARARIVNYDDGRFDGQTGTVELGKVPDGPWPWGILLDGGSALWAMAADELEVIG